MPEDIPLISHDDILRYEEILRLCAIAAGIGIRNIRVTGGEPLVRKGCTGFICQLKAIPGIDNVTLTTNGALLEPHIKKLAECKLDGLNISLDSMGPEAYLKITGRDAFHDAFSSISSAVRAGLRVKVNCVAIKGLNENEIIPIARLAEKLAVDIRFIEFMPTGAGDGIQGVPAAEIMNLLLSAYPDLAPDRSKHGFGPAHYYKSSRLDGTIGLIDAISSHFCDSCNRLRLTCEGQLKLCLFSSECLDLRSMLRSGATDNEIGDAITHAVDNKPKSHQLGRSADYKADAFNMSQIGG